MNAEQAAQNCLDCGEPIEPDGVSPNRAYHVNLSLCIATCRAKITSLTAELTAAHAALDAWQTYAEQRGRMDIPKEQRTANFAEALTLTTKARELRARREGK